MDDHVIDLVPYLQGNQEGNDTTFAIYGGGGTTSRFALPVWRAIYLLEGDRGGILALKPDGDGLDAVFILDLKEDPARIDFPVPVPPLTRLAEQDDRVARDEGGEWLSVCLGGTDGVDYFLVITGAIGDGMALEESSVRQDLMFLAGECAGLLFHWGIAQEDRKT